MGWTKARIWTAVAAICLSACGGASTLNDGSGSEGPPAADGPASTSTVSVEVDAAALAERMFAIDDAVAVWRTASSMDVAQDAAETAANLIVGPNGPGYGDRDGDGDISGEAASGVLPGLDGLPEGLAIPLAANGCIARDVLGGTWEDPGAEWGSMLSAIDEWRPGNNTMPTLASHPMRVVGWATFTLESDSLGEAHEYAGHAKLHVDISIRALSC